MELSEEAIEGSNRISEKKHFLGSQGMIIPHYLYSSPPGNWAQLDETGGDEGMEEQEAIFFGTGICIVNNSCKGSHVYWRHYNLEVFFPKSGFNGKWVSPFLKQYSTISLLSLESALGAPGMKGALRMKADIYDYCLKGTERNTNVKYEWLLVLKNVLLTWCQRR